MPQAIIFLEEGENKKLKSIQNYGIFLNKKQSKE